MSNKNKNARYIARIKELRGKFGKFFNILIDNPHPTKKDGEENPYYKGNLLWFDVETKSYYKIKSMAVKGVNDDMKKHGYINTIMIDLGDEFQTEKLENN